MKKFLAFATLLVVSLSLFEARGFTTNAKERPTFITVRQMPAWTEQPLEIVGLRVRGTDVAIGRSFQAGDTWLKDLAVTVKNVSQVSIVGFNVGVGFQKDLTGNEAMPPIEIRRGIDYSMGQLEGENISLRPGETMEASVEISWYESTMFYTKHLENLPEDILNNVSLRLLYAGYDSHRIWVRGNHMRRQDATTFVTDEEYGKKMHKIAKLMHEQKAKNGLEKYGLRKASFYSDDSCADFDGTQWLTCLGSCSNCVANTDLNHFDENGWVHIFVRRGCQKVVGGQWVACVGCSIIVDQVNIGITC